jgi:o-succinylbenzoate---CoA ligase
MFGIFAAAETVPEQAALVTETGSMTYAELARGAARALGWLSARGVDARTPGTVAVVAESTPSVVELLHALFWIGAPALLLHPRLTAGERDALLRAQRPALLADASWAAQAPGPGGRIPALAPDDERPLAIVMSSGSTGSPRPVVLSRRALQSAALASAEHLGWDDRDRWLACLPLSHVGGLSILIRCALAGKAVVLANRTTPERLARLASSRRATLASLVPAQLARWVELPELPRLRALIVGGAGASPQLLGRARERGLNPLASYGLSETAGQVATQSLADLDLESVGRPLPGVELSIEAGRVRVRGAMLASDLPLSDGWFSTDDLGGFDAAGRLLILGRASDRIVTGGENVDPLEVERAIEACAGVASACVFGLTDPVWGERVAAAVVPACAFDRQRLAAHVRDALAAFKRPRSIAVVSSLVLLPSGKIDRSGTARIAQRCLEPLT